jgi:hypothetical protein
MMMIMIEEDLMEDQAVVLVAEVAAPAVAVQVVVVVHLMDEAEVAQMDEAEVAQMDEAEVAQIAEAEIAQMADLLHAVVLLHQEGDVVVLLHQKADAAVLQVMEDAAVKKVVLLQADEICIKP